VTISRGMRVNKTKKVLLGITAVMTTSLVACEEDNSSEFIEGMKAKGIDFPVIPESEECFDWEFDMSEGVWACDEKGAPNLKHLYFRDTYFKTESDLKKNESYKSYASNAGFAGDNKLSKDFPDGISKGTVMRGFGSESSSGG
jgi:uncharacterized lipoprotein NlpE involved in copper resistance